MSADELTPKQQMTLFALMAVARPATNRELWEVAGVRVEGKDRERLNALKYVTSTRRGTVNVHGLTSLGLGWCTAAMAVGRPEGTRFPTGVLYAVLNGVANFLVDREPKEVFKPDLETWIRAAYAEITLRRPGADVRLAKLRPWLEDVPQQAVDAELDRMIELPDVFLEAQLKQGLLTEEDHKAAVMIGEQPRHLLRIGPA